MIKNTLALLTVVALTACSSGSDSPSGDPSTPGTPGTPITPAEGTKAGTYTGDFGAGNGVYVIDNDNYMAGLALASDGSATSLFADLGDSNEFNGNLRQYFHEESKPDGAAGSFGAVAQGPTDVPVTLSISFEDGINGSGFSLTGASAGQLTVADEAALAGSWQGAHGFCNATECFQLVTSMSFSGGTLTGSTQVDDGNVIDIAGSVSGFGEVSLVTFTWGGNTYTGAAFFVPDGSGRLAFFGESPESETVTIASLLSRQ